MNNFNKRNNLNQEIEKQKNEIVNNVKQVIAKIFAIIKLAKLPIILLLVLLSTVCVFNPGFVNNIFYKALENENMYKYISSIPILENLCKDVKYSIEVNSKEVIFDELDMKEDMKSRLNPETNYKVIWTSLKNNISNKNKLESILKDVKSFCKESEKIKEYCLSNNIEVFEDSYVDSSDNKDYINIICESGTGKKSETLDEIEFAKSRTDIYKDIINILINESDIHKKYNIGTTTDDEPYSIFKNNDIEKMINLTKKTYEKSEDFSKIIGYYLIDYIIDVNIGSLNNLIKNDIDFFQYDLKVAELDSNNDIVLNKNFDKDSSLAEFIVKYAKYDNNNTVIETVKSIVSRVDNNTSLQIKWEVKKNGNEKNEFIVSSLLIDPIMDKKGYIDTYLVDTNNYKITPIRQETRIVNKNLDNQCLKLGFLDKDKKTWPYNEVK